MYKDSIICETKTGYLMLGNVIQKVLNKAKSQDKESLRDFCSHFLTPEEIGVELLSGVNDSSMLDTITQIEAEIERRMFLFEEVLTATKASEMWGIDRSTLTKSKHKFLPEEFLIDGRVVIVTKYGMERVFGKLD